MLGPARGEGDTAQVALSVDCGTVSGRGLSRHLSAACALCRFKGLYSTGFSKRLLSCFKKTAGTRPCEPTIFK